MKNVQQKMLSIKIHVTKAEGVCFYLLVNILVSLWLCCFVGLSGAPCQTKNEIWYAHSPRLYQKIVFFVFFRKSDPEGCYLSNNCRVTWIFSAYLHNCIILVCF